MSVFTKTKSQGIYKIFKLGVILMTLTSMLGLSGCNMKEANKPKEVKLAEKMLKEKYKEDFTIYSMGARFGTLTNSTFTVICSPSNNPDLKFEAQIDKDGYYINDEYVSTRVSALIAEAFNSSLKNNLKNFLIKVAEAGTFTESDNSNISIEEYHKIKPTARFVAYLIIDKEALSDVSGEELYSYINTMLTSVPKLNGSIVVYFATDEILQETVAYTKENARLNSTFEDILKNCNSIFTRYTNSTLDMPSEEFEAMYK